MLCVGALVRGATWTKTDVVIVQYRWEGAVLNTVPLVQYEVGSVALEAKGQMEQVMQCGIMLQCGGCRKQGLTMVGINSDGMGQATGEAVFVPVKRGLNRKVRDDCCCKSYAVPGPCRHASVGGGAVWRGRAEGGGGGGHSHPDRHGTSLTARARRVARL